MRMSERATCPTSCIPAALCYTMVLSSFRMAWLITPQASRPCLSATYWVRWRPHEEESGGPGARRLANSSPAVWRVGDGCEQRRGRIGRPRLGCDAVRDEGFDDGRPS